MRSILLKIMSEYCWLTVHDVVLLLDYYTGQYTHSSDVAVRLSHMYKNGDIERKEIESPQSNKTAKVKYVYKLLTTT